ncbi:MAG: sigma-54-dependent Fis family transcriptional regulator [Salinisphaeraceae bacterium]|nr:sigma-54-dependent Fis family transcriptional regulator [Salinisphaeraceae bacterium]
MRKDETGLDSIKPETTNVMRAWEAFLSGEPVPSSGLRPVVLQSWQRSRSREVDPQRQKAPLQSARLQTKQLAHDDLLQAAQPVLADTVDLLTDQGALVLLCNPEGLILESRGSRSSQEAGVEANIVPGGLWQEEICGTNAVGTALAAGQAVQVHASEHYCAGVKSWTCAASLVHDPGDGRLLGALDISYQNEILDSMALPLIVAAARRVEAILRQMQSERHSLLLDRYIDSLPHQGNDGLLLINKHGRLLRQNERVTAILETRGVDSKVLAGGHLGRADARSAAQFRYPDWIEPDWVKPVQMHGRDIGAIVQIPAPGATPRSHARTPQAEIPDRGDMSDPLANHRTPAMRDAVAAGIRVAPFDLPVLIQGETGTGKELLAHAIHRDSPRRDKSFVAVNCGAIPRELLASELFGHEEGAFTGARRGGAAGKFEQARGGTLFLDELGELPLDLQPYLLRVLEERAVTRLGGTAAQSVDVRIIAATNRNLLEQVRAGRFRDDLYYRFRLSISLPPLRERVADVDRYLDRALACAGSNYGCTKRLDQSLRELLRSYAYPGNLRELTNIIEYLVVMNDATLLTPAHLPALMADGAEQMGAQTGGPHGDLRRAEQRAIEQALSGSGGNRSEAARRLGISRATLYRRLQRYDDDPGAANRPQGQRLDS